MGSRRGGERVLESRHLIGLFLGVVLLCCVFFTLGYVMGKTQYGNSPVEAASIDSVKSLPSAAKPTPVQSPSSTEWDFYTEKKTTDVPLEPARRGESQSSRQVASTAPAQPAPLVFSPSVSSKPPAGRREVSPSRASRSSAKLPPPRFRVPRMSRNAVVLQVGALRQESDALAMADALQRKGFPAFVVVPASDSYYRVQVGPFPTQAIGEKAKQSLLREGFKAIYRR